MLRTFWDTWTVGRQPRLSGQQVLAVVAFVFVVTVIAPPTFGWGLNRRRVTRTTADAARMAQVLRYSLDTTARQRPSLEVVCGPGRLPSPGPTGQWVSKAVQASGVFPLGAPADAWGRCFLVNLSGLRSDGPVWVMSGGRDGRITTLPTAPVLDGDDVGVRIK